MKTLKETVFNNIMLSLIGINFTNPFFRRIAGQFPYEVPTLTISESDDKEREKLFKQICKEQKESFILVIRNNEADLENILFVPSPDEFKSLINQLPA
jgi:hypothetical protein